MHTFGFPTRVDQIVSVCQKYNIVTVEDAAESLGSSYHGVHTGRYGKLGTFSFNGNKTVTSGGGGAIITDDPVLAKTAKHLSTTAKQPHSWEFFHDAIGFNYRMPNINAALACAQLEQLPVFLKSKRDLAESYAEFFQDRDEKFVISIAGAEANNWLNTIILPSKEHRDRFLEYSNGQKVNTRPIWRLMNELPMYSSCMKGELVNAKWLEERVVNLPSSYRPM
jgi:dTDP-4-amino-4,6-dideoxygalactose transaminase